MVVQLGQEQRYNWLTFKTNLPENPILGVN